MNELYLHKEERNKVYLVTGVAGFIGSHIAEELLKDGKNVIGIDNFYSGKKENIEYLQNISSDIFDFVEIDIRDINSLKKLFSEHKIDFVFHQAAIASVQKSIENPVFTNEVNVQGTLNILEASRENGVKKIVFASSAAVYGDEPTLPKNENSIIKPISPYGLEKYICEEYLKLYSNLYGLKSVALRYFNVYGERQDPSSEYSGVISIFDNKIKNGETITIFGDGEQYRDFVYVKDVVQANINAMWMDTGDFNIFCVGTGEKTTVNDLANVLQTKYDSSSKIAYTKARRGDIEGSVCDNTKLLNHGLIINQVPIHEGIVLL